MTYDSMAVALFRIQSCFLVNVENERTWKGNTGSRPILPRWLKP
jgi:hypothetical protein